MRKDVEGTKQRKREDEASHKGESSSGPSVGVSLIVDPVTRYQYLVDTGVLKPDSHQATIIQKLQRLWTDLKTYDPGEISTQTEDISPSFVSVPPRRLEGTAD
jgi:predicted ATPase